MYQREFERKARIGLVGVGSHAYRNLLPALHFLPAELVAMTSRGQEKLQKTAAEYGCRTYPTAKEMYENEELDGVIISVSLQMHPELAIEALSHGVNVFLEKPPAMRASQVEEMIAARGDKIAAVGFKKAFTPGAIKAREVLETYGKTAGLRSFLGVYPMTLPDNGAEILESRTFTNWLGNGCHPLSLMMSCAGDIRRICAHHMPGGQGMVAMEFANGAFGNLHLAQEPMQIESYHLYGGSWRLSIENTDRITFDRGIPFEYAYTDNFAPAGFDSGSVVWLPQNCVATLENKSLFMQGMVGELQEFLDAVLDGKKQTFTSLEFALKIMRAYEAVLLSEGSWIEL